VSCWFERANAARGEGTQRPGASALGRFFCVPGMGRRDSEVEVLCGSWSQRPRANRKAPTARGALKEAGSETASVGDHREARKSELAGHDRFFRRRVAVSSLASAASRLR
jgi:hypothetical protein